MTTPGVVAGLYRRLSVLMPVYNEARTLRTIVGRVLAAPVGLSLELVIVDDGSTDGSRALIAELATADPRIRPVYHHRNRGKGTAIRTAIAAMTGDLAVIQDADLEYNPADYPALLRPLLDGVADAVFGSRFLTGSRRRVLYFWPTVANKLLTLLCNVLNNINLTDMETGYKAVRADILKALPLTARSFTIEPELTARLAQAGARLYEVPISYEGRTYADGKKIGFRDALLALGAMVKYRLPATEPHPHRGRVGGRGMPGWLLRQVLPYIGQRVLAAGGGSDGPATGLLDRHRLIWLGEDARSVNRIRQRYGHLPHVSARELDLARLDSTLAGLGGENLDTVLCSDLLERAEDDGCTLREVSRVLRPGGHVIAVVPAYPWLFAQADRLGGRRRRYTLRDLELKLCAAGLEVVHRQGFNRLGGLGWLLSRKLLRRTAPLTGRMSLFRWLLPVARVLEHVPILPHAALIAVGRKPAGAPWQVIGVKAA